MKTEVASDLLDNIISQFFFKYLRTDRELGYVASAAKT